MGINFMGRARVLFAPDDAGTAATDNAGADNAGTLATEESKGTVIAGATPAPTPQGEDWRAALGEDLRPKLEKFASAADLAKSYVELQSSMGKRVVVPDENATEEQIAAYREKIGLPKTVDEYKLAIPEDLPEGLVDPAIAGEELKKYAAMAHEAGIPPAHMQKLVNQFYADQAAAAEQAVAAETKATEVALGDLFKSWGRDKDTNITYAQRTLKQFDADGKFTEFVNTASVGGVKLGNHPAFLELFARMGRAMAEDGAQLAPTQTEVVSYREQADAARKKRDEARARGDMAEAMRFDAMERDLLAKLPAR